MSANSQPFMIVIHRSLYGIEEYKTAADAAKAGYTLPPDYVGHEPVIIIVD